MWMSMRRPWLTYTTSATAPECGAFLVPSYRLWTQVRRLHLACSRVELMLTVLTAGTAAVLSPFPMRPTARSWQQCHRRPIGPSCPMQALGAEQAKVMSDCIERRYPRTERTARAVWRGTNTDSSGADRLTGGSKRGRKFCCCFYRVRRSGTDPQAALATQPPIGCETCESSSCSALPTYPISWTLG